MEATAHPKIGIIDSGVGGLSVLKEIHALLPDHPIQYIADSAWCPYGNKSSEVIRERVFTLTDQLLDLDCQLIVIACNSATIAAVEALRAHYPIPFTGMEPAVKPASKATNSGVIGVLATEASLAGEKFHHLVNTHGQGVRVITTPCPTFVELVEQGILTGEEVESAIKLYTKDMLEAGADTLVLGCTHYPFLKETIQQVVGPDIKLIDTGPAVARQTQRLASELTADPNSSAQPAEVNIATTGDLTLLKQIFPTLCPDIKATLRAW